MSNIVVGIDLGTTNTCVACYFNERLKILENDEGGRITPSFLFITTNKVIVGQYARRMAEAKPERGIYEVKRLIGRTFNDPYVQKNRQYFSFSIENSDNKIVASINQNGNVIRKTPEDLCAAILRKIKTDVGAKTGETVDKAVITVPAYFNVKQREATLAAATSAGFVVLKLLNEPTAAALSYYLQNETSYETYSLVYDLGGGTFDVAILKRNQTNVDIVAVDGDTHLGGHDFDNLIVDYVCEILANKYGFDAKSDRRVMRRIHNECEEAKKTLSWSDETAIVLHGVAANKTVEIDLTRNKFEELCGNLFEMTITIVDDCLKRSGVKKSEIKEVILSGGSTRIPKIQALISNYFDGKVLNKFLNPDECVAEGAAVQAALFSKHPKQTIDAVQISDVCPLSLGISNFVDLMTFVIERNTAIPVSRTVSRITVIDQQKTMTIEVYEGERMNSKKNYYLGKIVVEDITPAPPGQCAVLFTMSLDHNGILKVTAKEKFRNNVKDLTIMYTRGRRSDKEIRSALQDAKDNEEEDEHFKLFAFRKEYLLDYCTRVKFNLDKKDLVKTYKDVYDLCSSIRLQGEDLGLDDDAQLDKLLEEVKEKCTPLTRKYNFELMPAMRTT